MRAESAWEQADAATDSLPRASTSRSLVSNGSHVLEESRVVRQGAPWWRLVHRMMERL